MHKITPSSRRTCFGHGASDKPRADYSVAAYANGMRDLLSVLDIERVTVVGHSLGGGVAMQFAYQFPERCERLVLVSTGGISREVHPLLRFVAGPLGDEILPLLRFTATRAGVRAALWIAKNLAMDIGRDAKDFGRVFEALPNDETRRAFARTLRAVIDWRGQVVTMLDRCYLAADIPTLLVWGEYDAVIPFEQARIAHAAMPGSRLETIEDAGHFPHHTHPERFRALLHEFLSTTAPASYDAKTWRARLHEGSSWLPRPACPVWPRQRLRAAGPSPTAREPSPGGKTHSLVVSLSTACTGGSAPCMRCAMAVYTRRWLASIVLPENDGEVTPIE